MERVGREARLTGFVTTAVGTPEGNVSKQQVRYGPRPRVKYLDCSWNLVPTFLFFLCLAFTTVSGDDLPKARPPETKRADVVDNYFGVKVADPYRWLEDQDSPETRAWINAQQAYARAFLDEIPGRVKLEKRIEELMNVDSTGVPVARNGRYFFMERKKNGQLFKIYLRQGASGKDEVLVDPALMSPDVTTSVRVMGVSRDGALLAYAVQHGGEDASSIRIFDVKARRDLPDQLPLNFYGSLSFTLDNAALHYSRYGTEGPRIFRHRIGSDPKSDLLIFGEGIGPKSTIGASLSDDGRYLLINVVHGWSKTDVYLENVAAGGPVLPLVKGLDGRFRVEIGGDRLFILTDWKAPKGRLLVGDLKHPAFDHWRELVPQSEDTISDFSLAGGKLFVRYLENAIPRVRIFVPEGKPAGQIQFSGIGSVSGVFGRWGSNEAFFTYESFNIPPTIYRYDVSTGARSVWVKSFVPFDGDKFEVEQRRYASNDGTRAPIFIVSPKGTKRNGSNPTMLHGYGGFNVSMTPSFSTRAALWLESGGVYGLAILRGGGEFGEEWHQAGMLGNKQNVFDDFIAAAEWLTRANYTNPQRLVINGVSNGGLLVGAAMTQRPDLFRVVICRKPDLDMLRRHIQAHNVYATQEYGSSDNPEQFQFLNAYSPYQQVKRGTRYPAVLLTSGDADQRVQPFQARKMTAVLQWATASRNPILLLYDKNAGHNDGSTLNQDVAELTDEFSFIFWQLGMM